MARTLRLAGVAALAAAGWLYLLPPAPAVQPLAFNHAKHAGTACAVCHRGIETSARAGIPQADACLKCHAAGPAGIAAPLWDEAARSGRIGWVRVSRVPDHAMFSHQRHVAAARLDCASCHGDVGRRTTPPARAPIRLDMDACLACHRQEGASLDCAACHR